MNKYILLDRDGTINIEKDYLYKIEDFEYEYGVIEALEIFQKKGYKLAVITNQSGIGRGYYSEEDFLKLTSFVENDLKKITGQFSKKPEEVTEDIEFEIPVLVNTYDENNEKSEYVKKLYENII